MADILDYLDWRGDLSFAAAPFNEVDNYIITKIGTPDYTGFIPADGEKTDIRTATELLFAAGAENRGMGPLASKSNVPMLRRLPDTVRFGSLKLSHYVNHIDFDNTEQFSAVTVELPDGTSYISYRGTDETIIAWKENFCMAIMDTVPAQRDALAYLIEAAELCEGELIVGGHSKGGNLAVYAAACAPKEIQDRITVVYNNDGPGFRQEFLASEGYQRIKDKIRTIVSQNSIVGTLLVQEETPEVVESSEFGIGAHDGFTWQVLGDHFVRHAGLSRSSIAFDEALDAALETMDTEQRKAMIDELFDGLMSTGAVTLTDISEAGLLNALEILRKLRRSPEVHKFAEQILELMLREYRELRKMRRT